MQCKSDKGKNKALSQMQATTRHIGLAEQMEKNTGKTHQKNTAPPKETAQSGRAVECRPGFYRQVNELSGNRCALSTAATPPALQEKGQKGEGGGRERENFCKQLY